MNPPTLVSHRFRILPALATLSFASALTAQTSLSADRLWELRVVPKADVDRTVYVGMSIQAVNSARDYGSTIGIASIVKAYQDNPNLAPDEAIKIANQSKSEFIELGKKATRSSTEVKDVAEWVGVAIDAIHDGSAIAGLDSITSPFFNAAKSAVKIGAFAYENSFGETNQVMAQMKRFELIDHSRKTAEEQWRRAYDLSQLNPKAKVAIDVFAAPTTGIKTSESAALILQQNDLSNDPSIRILQQQIDGSGNAHISEVQLISALGDLEKRLSKQLGQSLNEIRQNTETHRAYINGKISRIEVERAGRQREEREQARITSERLGIEAAKTGVLLISTFAGAISPDLSKQIATAGGSLIQLTDATFRYAREGANLTGFAHSMSGAILAGNILGAALNIIGLLGPSGPDATQLIFDELDKIRRDIRSLSEQMRASFEFIDRKLSRVIEVLDQNFTTLKLTQDEIKFRTINIQERLMELSTNVSSLQQRMRVAFKAITDRSSIGEASINCGAVRRRHPGLRIRFSDFRKCLDQITHYAVVSSKQISQVETPQGSIEKGDITDLLLSHLDGGDLYDQVDFLIQLGRNRYFNSALPEGTLANPIAWMAGVDAYFSLLDAWPEFGRLVSVKAIDEMMGVGEEISYAISGITNTDGYQGRFSNRGAFFHALINQYSIALTNLRNRIIENKKIYENTYLSGYDLLNWKTQPLTGSISIPDRFRYPNIPAMGERGEYELVAPNNLLDQIPPLYKKAVQLGLGRIDFEFTRRQITDYYLFGPEDPKGVESRIEIRYATNTLDPGLSLVVRNVGGPIASCVSYGPYCFMPPCPSEPLQPGSCTLDHGTYINVEKLQLENLFQLRRNSFLTSIRDELMESKTSIQPGSLRAYGRALDAAKLALQSYALLGLNNTVARSPLLGALLFGENGLPDSKDLSWAFEYSIDIDFFQEFIEKDSIQRRVKTFSEVMREELDRDEFIDDPHPIVARITSQLSERRMSAEKFLPKKTPREAIESIYRVIGEITQ